MFRSTDVYSRRLPQGSERRKRACSAATTRLHERLAFEKPLLDMYYVQYALHTVT